MEFCFTNYGCQQICQISKKIIRDRTCVIHNWSQWGASLVNLRCAIQSGIFSLCVWVLFSSPITLSRMLINSCLYYCAGSCFTISRSLYNHILNWAGHIFYRMDWRGGGGYKYSHAQSEKTQPHIQVIYDHCLIVWVI